MLRLDDHIDNLVALVERLDLQRVTLVAQDWGGAIGLGAMLRMPERLERIVLFNTGAFPPPYIPWRIRACRIPLLGRLAVQGGGAFSRAALRMTLARKAKLDAGSRRRLPRAVRLLGQPPRRVRLRQRHPHAARTNRPGKRSPKSNAACPTLADRPALLVWGMRDWCFRPDCLERFERVWPQAEVHRLADVGHWVMEDAPEEAVPLVEQFLDATDSHPRELDRSPPCLSPTRVRIAKAEHVFSAAHFITYDGQCERLHPYSRTVIDGASRL